MIMENMLKQHIFWQIKSAKEKIQIFSEKHELNIISTERHTTLPSEQPRTERHMRSEYRTSLFNRVLPVIDNHPQSRFGLQNHLKLLIGKLPTRIKRKNTAKFSS